MFEVYEAYSQIGLFYIRSWVTLAVQNPNGFYPPPAPQMVYAFVVVFLFCNLYINAVENIPY